MKIALLGYGAMGQLVASRAKTAGDDVGWTMRSSDAARSLEEITANLQSHDAAIDFSVGSAVRTHVQACAGAQVPLVVGTTGWNEDESEVKRMVSQADGALVYGANFSVGVNLFYRIVSHAASLFASVEGYAPFIEEAHHMRKRDAPSGTALRLRDLMTAQLDAEVPVASTRAGFIPGTHKVGFDSVADQLTLTHMARSRDGFAAGALLAAHWIVGQRGVYEFSDVIDEIVKKDF